MYFNFIVVICLFGLTLTYVASQENAPVTTAPDGNLTQRFLGIFNNAFPGANIPPPVGGNIFSQLSGNFDLKPLFPLLFNSGFSLPDLLSLGFPGGNSFPGGIPNTPGFFPGFFPGLQGRCSLLQPGN